MDTTILSAGAHNHPYPAQSLASSPPRIEIDGAPVAKVPRLPVISSSSKSATKTPSPRNSSTSSSPRNLSPRKASTLQPHLSTSPPRGIPTPDMISPASSTSSSPPSSAQSSRKIRMIGNYCVERTIGRGQFGKVKLAYHKRVPDLRVAIKIINKAKLDDDTLRMIQREVRIIKLLNHPNIVRLYEVIETSRTFFLIMEYAEGGEVMDFIIAHGKIPEREAKRFFVQMVSAVQYCHSKRCCHRDIKPENLLLDSNMNIKIIDFGLSNIYTPGTLLKTFCGSPTYASPELILRKEYHGPAVDIWSMGVVLYVLVCGYLPFDGHNFSELFNKILKLQYTIPSYVSPECASLLKRMLVVDPSIRASIDEVRQHPWLSSVAKYVNTSMTQEISDLSRIDKEIVAKMEGFGFNIEEVVQALLNNCYNDAAATYFLLETSLKQKRSSGKGKRESAKKGTDAPEGGLQHIVSAPAPPKESTLQPPKERRFKKGHRRLHTVDACEQSDKPAESPSESPATSPRLQSSTSVPGRRAHATVSGATGATLAKVAEEHHEKERRGLKAILSKGSHSAHPTPPPKPNSKHRRTSSEVTSKDFLRKNTPDPAELLRPHQREHVGPGRHTDPRRHEERRVLTEAFDDSTAGSGSNPTTPRSIAENEEDWVLVEEDDEAKISRSPGRSAMSSIISSFKSMWKKHPKEGPPQPRVVRFAFSVNTTSDKQPEAIIAEVQLVLRHFNIPYTMKSPFYADCAVEGVRFSVEVCRLPRLVVNGIRLARISGSAWNYKKIVKDLVAHMNL